MTPINRRLFLAGSAALTMGAATARWNQALAQGNASHLRVLQPWEFTSLAPAESGYLFNRACIAENLVATAPDGTIVPALAERWSASDDARRWSFELRPGVIFHDGTPMTAEAVKTSFERLLPHATRLSAILVDSIEADGNTLTFNLKEPMGPFLSYVVNTAVSIFAPSSFGEDGSVVALVGTGPYRVEAVTIPTSLTLRRHEAYWDGPPAFETVTVEAVSSGDTRANMAIAREADLVMNIPTQSADRIAAAGMTIDRIVAPRVHVMTMDCAKPQFADVAVRQALNRAIDRVAIAQAIMGNKALAATQYVPPTLTNWHFDDLNNQYRFDPEAANAALDAAGWVRGSDGIREKDGVRFAGKLITFANRPELPTIAAALQGMWRDVGYDMSIVVSESAAIIDAKVDGTLDIALSSRNLVFIPDPIGAIAFDFVAHDDSKPSDVSVTNWRSAELNELVAAYLRTSDQAALPEIRREITRIIHDEVPAMPMVWYDQIIAISDKLDGFINDPYEQTYYLNRIEPHA
jgi:peptide/nickel transport system substrate-binding protein